jgi:hypothetical protein
MIPITPEIIGPGIEEEYADALRRIDQLEKVLAPFPASNDTREGRMVYLIKWLRQEIEGERLPIPLEGKYWGTLAYLIGEGSLDYLGAYPSMAQLANILEGIGLLKKRHYPVVVAMLDDFLDFVNPVTDLDPVEQKLIEECREMRDGIEAGVLHLPLLKSNYPGWKGTPFPKHLDQLPNFGNRRRILEVSLFSGWRPKEAQKESLAAPKPGLVWGGP